MGRDEDVASVASDKSLGSLATCQGGARYKAKPPEWAPAALKCAPRPRRRLQFTTSRSAACEICEEPMWSGRAGSSEDTAALFFTKELTDADAEGNADLFGLMAIDDTTTAGSGAS